MNAQEARKIAEDKANAESARQYNAIKYEIKNTAIYGKFKYFHHNQLNLDVIEKLRNEGYKVIDGFTQKDGIIVTISW